MATNTGRSYRVGAVRQRLQWYNPQTRSWTKRGPDGRYMDGKPAASRSRAYAARSSQPRRGQLSFSPGLSWESGRDCPAPDLLQGLGRRRTIRRRSEDRIWRRGRESLPRCD